MTHGPYAAGTHVFTVVADDAVQPILTGVLAPLRSPQPATGEYRAGRVSPRSAAYTVTYGGSRIVEPCSPEIAVETLLWHVNRRLVERDAGQHLLLHAAAVVKDDRLAVLPGRSGAGKTTLVAHLLTRGYRYVTDEIVIVDRRTLRVSPYPRTLALSVRSLQALSFERLASPKHLKNPVAVHQLGGTDETQALRPALLAFPQFGEQAGARWENLSPGQALLETAQHTFDFDRDPQASLNSLGRLADSCPAGSLTYSSLGQAERILDDRLHAAASQVQTPTRADRLLVASGSPGDVVVRLGAEVVVRSGVDGSLHRRGLVPAEGVRS